MLLVNFLSLLSYEMWSMITENGSTRRRWLPIGLDDRSCLCLPGRCSGWARSICRKGPILAFILAFLAVLRAHRAEADPAYPWIGGLLLAALVLMRPEMALVVLGARCCWRYRQPFRAGAPASSSGCHLACSRC